MISLLNTSNTVVEPLFIIRSNLTNFIANQGNSITGKKFAKELVKNLDKRFQDCGTCIEENSFANYLDPKLKGVHLKQFGKFELYKIKLKCKLEEETLTRQNVVTSLETSEGSLSPT